MNHASRRGKGMRKRNGLLPGGAEGKWGREARPLW